MTDKNYTKPDFDKHELAFIRSAKEFRATVLAWALDALMYYAITGNTVELDRLVAAFDKNGVKGAKDVQKWATRYANLSVVASKFKKDLTREPETIGKPPENEGDPSSQGQDLTITRQEDNQKVPTLVQMDHAALEHPFDVTKEVVHETLLGADEVIKLVGALVTKLYSDKVVLASDKAEGLANNVRQFSIELAAAAKAA